MNCLLLNIEVQSSEGKETELIMKIEENENMKNRSFGKIISLGLVMTVVALVFSSGAVALETENLDDLEGHNDTHNLHKEGYQMIEHATEKTHDKNTVGTHGSHNNYCNNINIDIKNVVNTDPHVHHPEEEHSAHVHSYTHHTNHEHPAHPHSHHAHIFNRVVARFLELIQSLRHILDLINNLGGMSG